MYGLSGTTASCADHAHVVCTYLLSAAQEQRTKVSMGYDDEEEYGGGGGGGGGGGYKRNSRSASPPKVVDVEKIKPNTEENKGEIRYHCGTAAVLCCVLHPRRACRHFICHSFDWSKLTTSTTAVCCGGGRYTTTPVLALLRGGTAVPVCRATDLPARRPAACLPVWRCK